MTTQSPGWYADPDRVDGQRWWSGTEWSTHRRATPPTLEGLRAAEAEAARPMTYVEKERAMRQANLPAYLGVVLGLLGVLFNLFGLVGLAAIVLSALGLSRAARLRRAGARIHGTVGASIGLALGILVTVRMVAGVVSAFLWALGAI